MLGPPDLTVSMAHSGNVFPGQTGVTYQITVGNSGLGSTSGTVQAAGSLPVHLTATGISGSGWACMLATLVCTRSDVLAASGSYPPITVTVNVSASAPASVAPSAAVAGGGETNTSNDTATDTTTVVYAPDLTVAVAHAGNLTVGQTGVIYRLAATNSGQVTSSGPVTVAATLSAGLSATSIGGAGWSCTLATLTCTRSDALPPGATYSVITVMVNVAAAGGSVTGTAAVSGGGELNTGNNTAIDTATVFTVPSFSLAASPNPATYGKPVTLTATLTSGTTGKVTFYDGATVLGVGAVSGGLATLTTYVLPSGSRSLHAHYSGDGAFAPADSAKLPHTVQAGASAGLKKEVEIASLYRPKPLAVADFNGDGKMDLLIAAYSPSLAVVPGNGDGTFGTPLSITESGTRVAIGDFNGDGFPDLALPGGAGLNVVPGRGDGTFAPRSVLTATYANYVVATDFNGDGNLDLVAASGNTVFAFVGKGDGTFQPALARPINTGSSYIRSLAVSDFNGDGRPDLVLGLAGVVSVMPGNGDGTFQPEVAYGAVSGRDSLSIAVEDLNGDGIADLAVAGTMDLAVLKGNGDGTFQPAALTGFMAISVSAADVNGDGIPDLAYEAPPFDSSSGWVSIPNGVLLGKGDGTFQASAPFRGFGFQGESQLLGDFNGDGVMDILTPRTQSSLALYAGGAITDLAIAATHASEFTRGQTGAVYKLIVSNVGDLASSGTVGVVDDRFPAAGLTATSIAGTNWTCMLATLTCTRSDSLAAGASFPPILITVNVAADAPVNVTNGAGVSGGGDANPANNSASDPTVNRTPTSTTLFSSLNPAALSQTVTFTAVMSAASGGKVTFYDGTTVIGIVTATGTTATFSTNLLSPGSHSIRARYDGDGVYGPSISAAVNQIVNAAPSYGFRSINSMDTILGLGYVVTGDFSGDGKPDLVVAGFNEYNPCSGYCIAVLLGRGDGTFQPPVTYSLGSTDIYALVAGDFNGDGTQDLAAVGYSGGLLILAGKGDGTFQAPVTYELKLPDSAWKMIAADFDGDGNLDLAMGGSTFVRILLGNGNGTFQPPTTITGGTFYGNALTAGDFNRDGKPDLVAGAPSNGLAILIGNGDGTFQPAVNYPGSYGNGIRSVAVADMNGDGLADIVTCYIWGIDVFLGKGDGTFQNPLGQSPSVGGHIAIGDFNGDGKLDVASNDYTGAKALIFLGKGDGTLAAAVQYQTSSVYGNVGQMAAGDFDGDGKTDLAAATDTHRVAVLLGGAAQGLAIAKSHTGRFISGQTGVTYTISTNNPGFAPVTGAVTVTDTLPAGLVQTAVSGQGWNCTLATLQCTRSDGLLTGQAFPDITVTANVAVGLPPSTITNVATASSAAGNEQCERSDLHRARQYHFAGGIAACAGAGAERDPHRHHRPERLRQDEFL